MTTLEATSTHREHAAAGSPRVEPEPSSAPATVELMHGALGCLSRDELVQQDLCAALLSTPGLDARHIEVEMTAAGVLLRGAVACPDDRARALRIAKRIAGPRPVREELSVLPGNDARGPRTASRLDAADAE
jgi:hypothetical protein